MITGAIVIHSVHWGIIELSWPLLWLLVSTHILGYIIDTLSSLLSLSLFYYMCVYGVQELEKMASDLSEQKKSIEDAAKVLREEKDTTET